MKPTLIDTILMSEKRKNVLILLCEEGEKDIDEIKSKLDVSSSALMPQMKKLLEWDLLIQDGYIYELSDIGELIVEKMQDLLKLSTLFEENHDYWKKRDLSKIPEHMLKRIGELGHCLLLEPDRHHLFEYHPVLIDELLESEQLMMSSSSFHPQTMSILCDAAEKGIHIVYVVTVSVFERITEVCQNDLEKFLRYMNTELWIAKDDDIGMLKLVVSDRFITMWLFDREQQFNQSTLISYEKSALRWGKDLFMYYRDKAKEFKYQHSDISLYP